MQEILQELDAAGPDVFVGALHALVSIEHIFGGIDQRQQAEDPLQILLQPFAQGPAEQPNLAGNVVFRLGIELLNLVGLVIGLRLPVQCFANRLLLVIEFRVLVAQAVQGPDHRMTDARFHPRQAGGEGVDRLLGGNMHHHPRHVAPHRQADGRVAQVVVQGAENAVAVLHQRRSGVGAVMLVGQ